MLASLIGTTGASMLLIRPLLQTNRERTRVTHTVIFFIFLVSNVGGMLTPLGDPPLFLGYLAGRALHVDVPAVAALAPDVACRCWRLLRVGLDRLRARAAVGALAARPRPGRAAPACAARPTPLWLAGVVLAVAFLRAPWREPAIVGAGRASRSG